jgi:nucleotide-binding universal stress UspA family protein
MHRHVDGAAMSTKRGTVLPQEQPAQTSSVQSARDAAPRPIVVGVDRSGRSASAVVWAADEAEHSGRSLRLVCATADGSPDAGSEPDLVRLGRRLALADLECVVETGDAQEVLLASAADASLLVVGRRGMGTAQRLVVGSTSVAVAGRAPVPTVVVPEQWMQPTMASAPVVVGIEPGDKGGPSAADDEVLAFAFSRAVEMRVPLIVVSAWAGPALLAWSPRDVGGSRARIEDALEARLAPWRVRHRDVEVVARAVAEPAAHALREAATVGQLTVIGRHSTLRPHAFRLGSTAREVLHHAERPVVVVPPPGQVAGVRATGTTTWAPMF